MSNQGLWNFVKNVFTIKKIDLLKTNIFSHRCGMISWKKTKKLELELQEKNKLLEQEEIIRKAIERASLKREKEYHEIEQQLQIKNKLLEREESIRKTIEEELFQKIKEYEQLKNSYDFLHEILVSKGLMKEAPYLRDEKETFQSQERRTSNRSLLAKDFNRTVIVRVEAPQLQRFRGFAKDISSGGLCLETPKRLKKDDLINVRLFFYGMKVPIVKMQAHIIWEKKVGSINYYGISFDREKDIFELNRYIESEITES